MNVELTKEQISIISDALWEVHCVEEGEKIEVLEVRDMFDELENANE